MHSVGSMLENHSTSDSESDLPSPPPSASPSSSSDSESDRPPTPRRSPQPTLPPASSPPPSPHPGSPSTSGDESSDDLSVPIPKAARCKPVQFFASYPGEYCKFCLFYLDHFWCTFSRFHVYMLLILYKQRQNPPLLKSKSRPRLRSNHPRRWLVVRNPLQRRRVQCQTNLLTLLCSNTWMICWVSSLSSI